ncbi:hypothetical protein [Massilia niabensis]|uniref:Uncharacterized protein n=1 Tax=Massilia niabensis TaxID=544910 RepID=A0ABW0L2C0_9BURK
MVAPGLILAPIIATACSIAPADRAAFTESLQVSFGKIVPLARAGRPSDIAASVLFFAFDGVRPVTARTLVVDSGLIVITGVDIGAVIAEGLNNSKKRAGDTETVAVGWRCRIKTPEPVTIA